jgi:FAD/FMN-containing dehydrogenase
MRYVEMFPPDSADYRPTAVGINMFVKDVDEAAAATILERLAASDAPLRVAQLRALGGAIADVPVEATAYAHRTAPIMVNIAAFFDGADDRVAKQSWVDDLAARLDQGEPGAYVNFVNDDGAEHVRAAYPGRTWERLRQVKSMYDPQNLFHVNHNIPPADPATP